MKILAIDSSGLVAGVAVMEDEKMTAEYTVNHKKTHSQTLMPMVDEVIKRLELDLNELDAVAVSSGPGSFTGLRIGASSAKGLAMALNKPVISVPTLEALAYNLYGFRGLVVPIMDARRNQVYTGIYTFDEKCALRTLMDGTAIDFEELMGEIGKYVSGWKLTGEPGLYGEAESGNYDSAARHGDGASDMRDDAFEVCFLGDGVPVFREYIEKNAAFKFHFAPNHLSHQRAGAVGALALKYFKEGRYTTSADTRPIYLRKSQAEREREKSLNGSPD